MTVINSSKEESSKEGHIFFFFIYINNENINKNIRHPMHTKNIQEKLPKN
jgi:hypothetical protein